MLIEQKREGIKLMEELYDFSQESSSLIYFVVVITP